MMKRLLMVAALAAALVAPATRSPAEATGHAERYYVSLGDSLAESAQLDGDDLTNGYAEQLHAALAVTDPDLRLKKFGCSGESTVSMRFGSQDPATVLSCGTQRDYRRRFPKGTQLAQAVKFLRARRDEVALVTINIGANDLSHLDEQGNTVVCLFEPAGCDARLALVAEHLAVILAELRAAAGPGVPIIGMTYYNVFAPLGDPDLDAAVAGATAGLESTYAAAGVPVADVAGAFHNGEQPLSTALVCAWTWFCTHGNVHPNTTGYGVIAHAFLERVQP
jgi:lysophospholipase L1-like esterase